MRRSIYLAVVSVCCAQGALAQSVNYIGPNDGLWTNAANWSGGAVPNAASFNVTTPDNITVRFDLPGVNTIGALQVGNFGRLLTAIPNPRLTVTGRLSGPLDWVGGTFSSTSTAVDAIDNAKLRVSGGGTMTVAATSWTGLGAYQPADMTPIFSASDVGSVLNLSTIQTLRYGPNNGFNNQVIEAANGGSVNLSGLVSIFNNNGEDDQLFIRQSGGSFNFNSLATIDNTTNSNSYVTFDVQTGTLALPALATTRGNVRFQLSANATVNAPLLTQRLGNGNVYPYDRSFVSLGSGATLNAAALTTMTYTTINPSAGSAINAPNLVDVTGSVINLPVGFTFNSGMLSTIDDAKFIVSAVSTFDRVTDTEWTGLHAYQSQDNSPIFQASGAGALLNLSSLHALRYGPNNGFNSQVIEASNGGTLNLSGLQTITNNPGEDDHLTLRQSSGTLQLAALATVDNTTNTNSYVTFDIQTGTLALPALTAARGNVRFQIGSNATVTANALVNRTGNPNNNDRSFINLATGATLNATSLTSLTYTTVNPSAGSTINAPALVDVTGSILNIPVGTTFNSGLLSTIDNARFFVGAVTTFDRVSDIEWTGQFTYNAFDQQPIFSANGSGAVLNLSSLKTLRYGPDNGFNHQIIEAANGGTMNLSGLQTINVINGQDDALTFRQTGGGSFNLAALTTIDNTMGNSNSYVNFDVRTGSLSLPALATATGDVQVDLAPNTTLTAPALVNRLGIQTFPERSVWSLASGATVNAAALRSFTYSTLNPSAGAAFNAPLLNDITGSVINISVGSTFNTGLLATIDDARISVGPVTTFSNVSDIEWTGLKTYNRFDFQPIFSANGSGAVLNLSSLRTIRYGPDNGFNNQTIEALNGGTINLSGLQTINVFQNQDDALYFRQNGGTFNLNSLATIDNTMGNDNSYVVFDVRTGTLSTPALTTARGNFPVTLAPGTTFSAPALVNRNGIVNLPDRSTWTLGTNSTVNAGAMTSLTYTRVNATSGATLNAPNLTNVTGSVLDLNQGVTFNIGTLSTIDDAAIRVGAGQNTLAISDPAYTNSTMYRNETIFSADGGSATLNLSSLREIEFGATFGRFNYVIRAANGGTVNLSNLEVVRVRNGEDDFLDFVSVGGTMNLSKLRPIEARGNTNDIVRFIAQAGGTIQLGEMAGSQRYQLITNDGTGNFVLGGGLTFDNDSQSGLYLAAGSTLSLPGRLSFAFTDENRFRADTSEIRIIGSDVQRVEVGGNDAGATNPGNAGNFGFGQLRIGTATQSSVVELIDVFDNGNRGTSGRESLYAYGLGGGPAGLIMQSGSLLAIGGINVYVNQNGSLVNLQTLFPSGGNLVPYTFNGSNGFILRGLTLSDGFYQSPDPGNRVFYDGPSGSWSNAVNWSTDLTPTANQEAWIVPAAGVTVTGPTSNATVRNLVVDRTTSGTTILNLNAAGVTMKVTGGLQIGTAGIVNLSAGTLDVGTTLMTGTLQTQAGTTYRTDSILNEGAIVLRGTTVAGATINNNTIDVLAGSHGFGPIVGPGTISVAAGSTVTTDRLRQAAVTINGTIAIRARNGPEFEVSRFTTYSFGPAGRVDIADNPLILDQGTLPSITTLVNSAYAGGAWNGPGIGSSSASLVNRTGVGYSSASVAGVTSFFGEAVDPTDMILRLTLLGDTNLDAVVNFDDLLRVAQNYGTLAGSNWTRGDFTYDGKTNFDDLLPLAQNYGGTIQVNGLLSIDPTMNARFQADWAQALAMVPEPTSLTLGLAGALVLRRRRGTVA